MYCFSLLPERFALLKKYKLVQTTHRLTFPPTFADTSPSLTAKDGGMLTQICWLVRIVTERWPLQYLPTYHPKLYRMYVGRIELS